MGENRLADQWLGFDQAELEEWFAAAGFAPPTFILSPVRIGNKTF
ncbi:MAG: hypothetical protein R2864_13370 [Syntrophotaleaceae bacterium]